MVENTVKTLRDILVSPKSANVVVDKLIDSIIRMEYSLEFNKLSADKEKISWAIANSEWKIMQWHNRRGNRGETYAEWKDALISRFFRKNIEMSKFLHKKQSENQKLSEYIIDVETIGTRLNLSPETRMAFIKATISKKDLIAWEVINLESFVTEDLIARVEDHENWTILMKKRDAVISPKQIKSCNLSLNWNVISRATLNSS